MFGWYGYGSIKQVQLHSLIDGSAESANAILQVSRVISTFAVGIC